MKKLLGVAALSAFAMLATGCLSEADTASTNLSKDIEEFRVPRSIVAVNAITGDYLLQVKGYCSVETENAKAVGTVEITCKSESGYTKDFVYLSDNVTFVVEQIAPASVSGHNREIIWKPTQVIPHIEIK